MGLGSTAKKVQRLSTLAEKLYEKVNEILERLSDLTDRVETASEDVQAVRREQREQRAILESIAAEQGIDVPSVIEEADLEDSDTSGDQDERSDEAEAPTDAN